MWTAEKKDGEDSHWSHEKVLITGSQKLHFLDTASKEPSSVFDHLEFTVNSLPDRHTISVSIQIFVSAFTLVSSGSIVTTLLDVRGIPLKKSFGNRLK